MRQTAKSIYIESQIRELSKDFGGNLNDGEVMQVLKTARSTYYRYKRQIWEKLINESKGKR